MWYSCSAVAIWSSPLSTWTHWIPRDPSVLADQRRAYDEMRESCPVAHSEFMSWSLFRHADVVRVLEDPATYSSASRHVAIPSGMDPPDHARFRTALEPHFSDDAMAALEPRSRQIAIELLEPMLSAGEAELMEAFATPFPLRTLCTFLGWPEEQWECLGGWTHGNQQAAFSRDPAGPRLGRAVDHRVRCVGHPARRPWAGSSWCAARKPGSAVCWSPARRNSSSSSPWRARWLPPAAAPVQADGSSDSTTSRAR